MNNYPKKIEARIMNYYQDLWNNPDGAGVSFFKNVDFDDIKYRKQEHIFRLFLKDFRRLHKLPKIKVLEIGAGTGRMTRIMLETFGEKIPPKAYMAVEINKDNINRALVEMGHDMFHKVRWIDEDIMDYILHEIGVFNYFDVILASEVFMHIEPEDMKPVVNKLWYLLARPGYLINIDWAFAPPNEAGIKNWCFMHDYDRLYKQNGLYPLFSYDLAEIKQGLFCYQKLL